MKSLKTLLVATCAFGCVASTSIAADIQTVAGTMAVPNSVTLTAASETSTAAFVKERLAKELMSSSLKPGSRKDTQLVLDVLNQLGVSYDVYQLQGADKSGQKDAVIVAVDLKKVAQEMHANIKDPSVTSALSLLQAGELDPITEQLMLASVNMALPKETTTFTLPGARVMDTKDKSKRSLTVENVEPMAKIGSTKYQTYIVGSRLSLDFEGVKNPFYAKAALVMNPNKPTLYLALTSDVQRHYFIPILEEAFKSIK